MALMPDGTWYPEEQNVLGALRKLCAVAGKALEAEP